jgi:hypothetical protein
MENREAEGAVLVFRHLQQMPDNKSIVKIGYNKFLAYFGERGDGTWDFAIDILRAMIESETRAKEVGVDIAPQVASYAEAIIQRVCEVDVSLERDAQKRAQDIESKAGKISDAIRNTRANGLATIKSMANMLVALASGQATVALEETGTKNQRVKV